MNQKKIDLIRQIIAILTIIGCSYSFIMGIWTFGINFTKYSIPDKLLFVLFLGLYLVGVKLSIYLYNNNLKYLFLFEVFTLLQVFSIESSTIFYRFSTALNFLVTFKINENNHFIVGSKISFFEFFRWGFMLDLNYFYCSFNIATIIILIFINMYLSPKAKIQKNETE